MSKFYVIIATILFISCKNKFNGKIENRDNSFYLVNTSSDQAFQFTIKATETKDDTVKNYSTSLIELQPGEEKFLGKETIQKIDDKSEELDFLESRSIEISQPTDQEIKESEFRKEAQIDTEQKISSNGINPQALAQAVRNEFDTIINGRQMMYRYVYKSKATPVHKFQYSFKITDKCH